MAGEGKAMIRGQDKSSADIAFGEIRAFSYTAGFSRESAVHRLEWLLETDQWRVCGAGYSDINAFLRDVWLANRKGFQLTPDDRQKLARRIKELQVEASNRAIGRALGADERTIRRDLSDEVRRDAAGDEINAKEINDPASAIAAFAALPEWAEFQAAVNAARGADSGAPVHEAEIDEAFVSVESGFDADPRGSFATLVGLIKAGAVLWAHATIGIGRRLSADKARFQQSRYFMLLDELGYTADLADAFMAETETPVEELANTLIATRMEELLQPREAE
jgi:hypothetical protein